MTPPLDKPGPAAPVPVTADPDGMEGFEGFAEGYIAKYPAAFERSSERRALYGEDRERELADLEAGTHPLLAPAR